MNVPAPFKSIIYLVFSVIVLYVFGNIAPKTIDKVPEGAEKSVLTALYWVAIFVVIGLPQYLTWFTENEIHFLAPIISMVFAVLSIMFAAVLTIAISKFTGNIDLSSGAEMFFYPIYWIGILFMITIPQFFAYKFGQQDG